MLKRYWSSDDTCLGDGRRVIFEGSLAKTFIFEGSLAEKLLFFNFKAQFFKDVPQKRLDIDDQSFMEVLQQSFIVFFFNVRKSRRKVSFFEFRSSIFEGNLAQKFRFRVSKLHFLKEVLQTSFDFEFPNQALFFSFQIHCISNRLNLTSSERRINSI